MYINKKAIPITVILLLLLAGTYLYTAPPEILPSPIHQDNLSTKIHYDWVETPKVSSTPTYHDLIFNNLEAVESYDLSNHHGEVNIFVSVCDFADTNTWQNNKIQEIQNIQNTSYGVFIDTWCYPTETPEFQVRFNVILSSLDLTNNSIYSNSYQNYNYSNITYLRMSKWLK